MSWIIDGLRHRDQIEALAQAHIAPPAEAPPDPVETGPAPLPDGSDFLGARTEPGGLSVTGDEWLRSLFLAGGR